MNDAEVARLRDILEPYHFSELQIVSDLSDPRRTMPGHVSKGCCVLDVGCGSGQSLTAIEFADCQERHGIDIDSRAIEIGQRAFPGLILSAAAAESIPYPDNKVDLIFSRVALPYTNIPKALQEICRVTKPAGRIWLSLHSWEMEKKEFAAAWSDRSARRLADRLYVTINSQFLAVLNTCFPRPWSGRYETFQKPDALRKLAKMTGIDGQIIAYRDNFIFDGHKTR